MKLEEIIGTKIIPSNEETINKRSNTDMLNLNKNSDEIKNFSFSIDKCKSIDVTERKSQLLPQYNMDFSKEN